MKYFVYNSILVLLFSLLNLMNQGCNSPTSSNIQNNQDTTSHNFTFQTWRFGEHSSSTLYDVAIIDENNIWAVGEIYLNDSTGQPDPHPYGIIHWNGTEWNVQKLTAVNPSGGISYITPTGIFCIDLSEIWLAGGGVYLFNGQSITNAFWLINYPGYNGGIFNNGQTAKRIFGIDSEKIFTVGNNGALGVYDGNIWHKLETGKTLDIYDIWGNKTNSGDYVILCIASDQFGGLGREILQIKNNVVDSISNTGLSNSLNAIWFVAGKKYYIGGDGLFSTEVLGNSWVRNTELPAYYKTSVRGNNINDVIVAGAYGLLLHYNGKSWMNYQDRFPINGSFGRVDIKGDIVCAVGNDNNRAVIVMGRRQ
jgi:hypothetical protein